MDFVLSPVLGTAIFGLAVLHTFLANKFQHWADAFPSGSIAENLLHLLGEVEVVFGLWSGFLFLYLWFSAGNSAAVQLVDGADFTEPLFVFVIMAVAATRPLIDFADRCIRGMAGLLPIPVGAGFYVASLTIGPLLGSAITEPGAMTVTALVLKSFFENSNLSSRFKYVTLGILFVNVSLGGMLTHFAAPPVVMVARHWNWDSAFMFVHFGVKAMLAVILNAVLGALYFRKELSSVVLPGRKSAGVPALMILFHLLILVFLVWHSHHPKVFVGAFLFFLGFANVTREYQSELKLREAGLVGFFLAGLVLLGSLQRWWVEPLIQSLGNNALYFGATALTAIVDNAALTFLAAQVPDISDASKYFVVAGAATGGGLTVIANAPNPIGFSVLKPAFGTHGIGPLGLFLGALIPTVIGILCLWGLPI